MILFSAVLGEVEIALIIHNILMPSSKCYPEGYVNCTEYQ